MAETKEEKSIGQERFLLGIDRLEALQFKYLQEKRVGLLTHPAGVNSQGKSTIDVLHGSQKVNLVALYGPEHGIYGDEKANVPVQDRIDKKTKLRVYSLYGKYRKPTAEMLSGIDVLVVDLQDVGVRSYTYISCMRYAMEACFENNLEMVVLDRPNPLGGLKVDGPMLEKKYMSYVGAFQVPYVHELTIGELARMAKETLGALDIEERFRRKGRLRIVPMAGWKRSMLWDKTNLDWVPTSTYIPDLSAALGYSMTGLGAQMGGFKHGIGTDYPFRFLTFRGKPLEELETAMASRKIPGISFVRRKDSKQNEGLYVKVNNWQTFRPTELSFHMMHQTCIWMDNPFAVAEPGKALLFNKHVGSEAWWQSIARKGRNVDLKSFFNLWRREAKEFQKKSRAFWIYKKI
ncbi:MAG: hypothetical protein CMI18_12855 [Opitutaceae bacterium]|nr:hypothetical protein [Opitutaceae bacterium]